MDDHQFRPAAEHRIACGGFLFLNSTPNTRIVWRELLEVHKMQMGYSPRTAEASRVLSTSRSSNWGNEQNTFSALMRQPRVLSVAWLNDDYFRSGSQLKAANFSLKNLHMIHANWMLGVERKVQYLKKGKLWFLVKEVCSV